MFIDILAILGVMAITIGLIEIFATESVGLYVIGILLDGASYCTEYLPLGTDGDNKKLEVPPLNRYEHPIAFWLVFVFEVSIGGFLLYPWVQRWLEI